MCYYHIRYVCDVLKYYVPLRSLSSTTKALLQRATNGTWKSRTIDMALQKCIDEDGDGDGDVDDVGGFVYISDIVF